MVFPSQTTPLVLKRRPSPYAVVPMSSDTTGLPKSLIRAITGLALFMLVLLLMVPLLLQDQYNADLIAYVVYAIFLVSLSVTIGMGLTYMMVSNQGLSAPDIDQQLMQSSTGAAENPSRSHDDDTAPQPVKRVGDSGNATKAGAAPTSENASSASLRASDEQEVIDFLKEQGGECWQSTLTKRLEWTASKTSRTLAKLEYDNVVKRIRDGMGKRIVLINKEK